MAAGEFLTRDLINTPASDMGPAELEAAVMALFLTPFNFTWMVASNPATAAWLRQLDIDASAIWWSLLALLALA